MRIFAIAAALFAALILSSCVAPFFATGVGNVGVGFSNNVVAGDTDCTLRNCGHDKAAHAAVHAASGPPASEPPEEPGEEPAPPPDGDGKPNKPGWGHGDKNHDHNGPPGHHN